MILKMDFGKEAFQNAGLETNDEFNVSRQTKPKALKWRSVAAAKISKAMRVAHESYVA